MRECPRCHRLTDDFPEHAHANAWCRRCVKRTIKKRRKAQIRERLSHVDERLRDIRNILPVVADYQATVECLVYVLEGKPGEFKIGYSKNVARRLTQFSTGQSLPLRIIAVIPGNRTLERELHERYSDYRLSGEWFRLSRTELASHLAAYPGAMVFLRGYITAAAPSYSSSLASDGAPMVPRRGTEREPSDVGDGAPAPAGLFARLAQLIQSSQSETSL